MKQKMMFQKISETFVMFSVFFAVHGRGGDALTTTWFPESKSISLSMWVEVRVRVTINLFPESKDGKIDLG